MSGDDVAPGASDADQAKAQSDGAAAAPMTAESDAAAPVTGATAEGESSSGRRHAERDGHGVPGPGRLG